MQGNELPEKVVGIDQIRIARGIGKICKCEKRKFVIDTDNRRVTCGGCGSIVDPYEAIYDIAYHYEEITRQVEHLLEQKREIAKYKPWLRVIKDLERRYRGHKMIPNCPRCDEPFYLEELNHWTGKQFADARIKRFRESE